MESLPQSEVKAPNEITRWAWDIHKDADALLHSRLQGFMAFNAILGGGYFLSSRITLVPSDEITRFIPLIIAVFAVFYGLVFFTYTRRMVEGIKSLKVDFLLKDDVYLRYYGEFRAKDGVKYWFAYGVPWSLILLWIILLAIGFLLAAR